MSCKRCHGAGPRGLTPPSRAALQPLRQQMQRAVAIALSLDLLDRVEHVIAVDAGAAVALAHVMKLLVERKPAGILLVAAVDHVAERGDALSRVVVEPDRALGLAVDHGDLLALAQVFDGARRAAPPPPGRRCRGSCRRGRGRAPGRAFPACRGGRRNRRRAPGARRSAGPGGAPGSRSPAATSASHSRRPTGRRWMGRCVMGSWAGKSAAEALTGPGECGFA